MRDYFSLQYRMINRQLTEIGLNPYIGYILITILFAGSSLLLFYKFDYAAYGYALMSLAITGQLSETRRNQFLQTCFSSNAYKQLRLLENMILTIPFAFFLLYKQEWLTTAVLLSCASLFAFFNIERKLNFTIPTPFFKFPFEFALGFRKTYVIIGFAYFLTIMSIVHNNFNVGIFALLVLVLVSLSYYSTPEPYFYVWIFSSNPKQFLGGKIKTALLYTGMLCSPVILALSIVYREHILILLVVLVVGMIFVIAMLLGKYALFPSPVNLPQGMMLALSVWFPPMLLFVIPYFYTRCIRQLNPILS